MSEDYQAKPQAEHQWLQQLVGEWTYESECEMGPDQPRQKFAGSASTRSIGGLWTVSEGRSEMPGGTSTMIFTFGYDPAKKAFVGTFIASVMNQLWIYEGQLDADRKILTLDTVGPSFTEEGKFAKYQDIIEIKSPDHHVLTSQTPGPDGQWRQFMKADYYRKS